MLGVPGKAMTILRAAVLAGRTAGVVGVITLFGILTVQTVRAIDSYRLRYPETTLEQQATTFLAYHPDIAKPIIEAKQPDHRAMTDAQTQAYYERMFPTRSPEEIAADAYQPTEFEIFLYGKEKAIKRGAAQMTACKNLIMKFAKLDGRTVTRIPLNAIPNFTAEPCYFSDPSVRPPIRNVVFDTIDVPQAIVPSLAITAVTAVATFIVLSLLVYTHVGWRRISVSAAPILGISLGAVEWLKDRDTVFALSIAVIGTLMFGPLILGGRELYLWIAKGFTAENKRSKIT